MEPLFPASLHWAERGEADKEARLGWITQDATAGAKQYSERIIQNMKYLFGKNMQRVLFFSFFPPTETHSFHEHLRERAVVLCVYLKKTYTKARVHDILRTDRPTERTFTQTLRITNPEWNVETETVYRLFSVNTSPPSLPSSHPSAPPAAAISPILLLPYFRSYSH